MCRKNLVIAVGLISFGAGILIGNCLNSGILCFLLAAAAIGWGILMISEKRRHK